MEEVILNAIERVKQNSKFREPGFIAGVIYGDNVESTAVKFEETPLRKIIVKHGVNAKVTLNYANNNSFGFIKDIQRHPVTNKIIHIDVQLVSKNHEVKLQIPISFKGESALIAKQLTLNIYKTEVDVFGKMAVMPDVLEVDISSKELGDTITIKDLTLSNEISITDKEDQIYAAITHMAAEVVEEVAEEPTEAEAVATEPEV